MDQADGVELLVGRITPVDRVALPGIEARRRGVGLPVDLPPLTPGIERQPLHHRAGLVGDDVERAEVILQEITGGDVVHARRAFDIDDDRDPGKQVLVPRLI